MTTITMREWQTLPHGDTKGCIPVAYVEGLVSLAKTSIFSNSGGEGVLEDRRNGLRARGVVGVIATEDCNLEILPKIDLQGEQSEENQDGAVRQRLVHMLAVAHDLKIETGRLTHLDWQKDTILEILIRIFCDKLTEAIRRGIPRRYISFEDELPALRGTFDATRQFTRLAANPSRLACKFDELSTDIALNRIMKATVAHLSRMSRNFTNLQLLRELAFVYADIQDVSVPALKWNDVILDRTNAHWNGLIGMSELFLKNRYQTTSSGSAKGTALLFEMNKLFETYIGKTLERAFAGACFKVLLQRGHKNCLTDENDRGCFKTKPDILIYKGADVVHIIDTKWKRIAAEIDDKKRGVSQSDVYQMMAYAQLYKAPLVTLLYPHHNGIKKKEGVQSKFVISETDTQINFSSINIAETENIGSRLANIAQSSISLPTT